MNRFVSCMEAAGEWVDGCDSVKNCSTFVLAGINVLGHTERLFFVVVGRNIVRTQEVIIGRKQEEGKSCPSIYKIIHVQNYQKCSVIYDTVAQVFIVYSVISFDCVVSQSTAKNQ